MKLNKLRSLISCVTRALRDLETRDADDDDNNYDNDDDGDVDVDDDDDQTPEKSCHRRSLALFCDGKILVKNLVNFFQLP